jgi:hypothetical protein
VLPESSSPQQGDKDEEKEAVVETTELEATEGATELDGGEEDETLGMSLMGKSMGFPDAEGTVFGDEEEGSDSTIQGDDVKREDESLVESLLDDEETVL